MRYAQLLSCVVLSAVAWGQQGELAVNGGSFRLGPTNAVAVGVKQVSWEPSGKALIFDARDADGNYQGVYRTDTGVGRPVFRLPEGTVVQDRSWLPKHRHYLEIVKSHLKDKALQRWSVVAIDAQEMKTRELLTLDYPEKEKVGMDLEVSPVLDHALVTVHDAKGSQVYVLLEGAGTMALSGDIARAKAAGSGFAGWSVDGTAYFSDAPGVAQLDGATFTIEGTDGKATEGKEITFKISLDGNNGDTVPVLGDLSKVLVGKLIVARTAPKAGTAVLEVMLWNGGLRPVRSRGPFVRPEVHLAPIGPLALRAQIVSGFRKGSSSALWLVGQDTDPKRDPTLAPGLLIASEAGQSWLSDARNWVAYETGGALFVRSIELKK